MSSGVTYGSCCYVDCPNSYSSEADVVFFKFPMDAARRKKWIENTGNPEISQLSDRQLRGKRICGSHFEPSSFTNPTTKDALTDKAIPVSSKTKAQKKSIDTKEPTESKDDDKETGKASEPSPTSASVVPIVKRGPGRPSKRDSLALALSTLKAESVDLTTPISKMTRSRAAPPPTVTTPTLITLDIATAGEDKDKDINIKVEPILSVEPVLSKSTRGRKSSVTATDIEPPVLKEHVPETTITVISEEPTPSTSTTATTPKRTTRSSNKESVTTSAPNTNAEQEENNEILPPVLEDQTQDSTPIAKKTRGSTAPIKLELIEAKLIETKRKSVNSGDDERNVKKVKPEPKESSTSIPLIVPIMERKTLTPQAHMRIQKVKEEFERKGHKGEKIKPSPIPLDPVKPEKRHVESQTIFEAFCSTIKSRCILPEEWSFSGIMNDSAQKMKFMSISEIDVGASSGPIKLKRIVQIYDDFTVKIWSEGVNVTHRFDAKKVHTESDVSHLLAKVMSSKICQGIRGFIESDQPKFPSTVQRDGYWYSCQCQIVVDKGHAGSVCPSCVKLRNTIRRKKANKQQTKSKILSDKGSKLESGLYNFLTKLADEEESNRLASNKAKALALLGEREVTSHDQTVNIPGDGLDFGMHGVGTSKAIKVKLDGGVRSAKTSRPSIKTRRPIKVMGDETKPNVNTPFTIVGQAGENSINTSGIPKELMDYIALQGGNIGDIVIQQNGNEFALGGGQEFEIVGEAQEPHQGSGIQVLEADENSGIQIIEVDDQTLAQLQAQNMGGMFSFQDSSNIQVTEIDANDPNNAFLKVINNQQYFIQQGGT